MEGENMASIMTDIASQYPVIDLGAQLAAINNLQAAANSLDTIINALNNVKDSDLASSSGMSKDQICESLNNDAETLSSIKTQISAMIPGLTSAAHTVYNNQLAARNAAIERWKASQKKKES